MRKRARSFTGDPYGFVGRQGGGAAGPTLVSIDILPDAPDVDDGLTVQLTAIGTYDDFSTQDLTAVAVWDCDDPSIATVVGGLVTGVDDGTAEITATVGGVVGLEEITVNPVAGRQTIAMSDVTTADSTTDGTVFNTASFLTVSGQMYYVGVLSTSVAESPGLVHDGVAAWTSMGTRQIGGSNRMLTVFRGLATSAATDTITITWPSSQASCGWSVVTGTGIETGGVNGADSVVQSDDANSASATTLNTTLAAFEHANNANLTFVGVAGNNVITHDPDFAELGDAGGFASNTGNIESQWATNVVACDPSWAPAQGCAMLSFEIKSAP